MKDGRLEVGDKIKIQSIFSIYLVKVERLTKTQAIAKPVNPKTGDFEVRFKIKCGEKGDWVHPVAQEPYSTVTYILEK